MADKQTQTSGNVNNLVKSYWENLRGTNRDRLKVNKNNPLSKSGRFLTCLCPMVGKMDCGLVWYQRNSHSSGSGSQVSLGQSGEHTISLVQHTCFATLTSFTELKIAAFRMTGHHSGGPAHSQEKKKNSSFADLVIRTGPFTWQRIPQMHSIRPGWNWVLFSR